MLIIILWFVLSMVVGVISKKRKLGEWTGFFLALIFSPLIGLIFALVSPLKEVPNTTANNSFYIADEIEKLSNLHASGAITEEEFQQQKKRLLK